MPDSSICVRKHDTYLAMIQNSVGTQMFRNLFIEVVATGEKRDVYKNGNVSCAAHVTSVLTLNQYLPRVRAEVVQAVQMMLQNGWQQTETPQPGDIIHWEKNELFSNEHIGFYIDQETAISNSPSNGFPIRHHITYNGTRKILGYYTRDYTVPLPIFTQ